MSTGNGSGPLGNTLGVEGLSLNDTSPSPKQFSSISVSDHARQHNGDVINTTNNYNYLPRSDDQLSGRKTNQALLVAAGAGHTRRVHHLLRKNADIDFADEDGLTALHHACISGFVDTAEILLEAGADIDARSAKYGTSLSVATLKERSGIITLLLAERANPNLSSDIIGSPLHLASLVGSLDVAKALLQAGASASLRATIDASEVERLRGTTRDDQTVFIRYECEPLILASKSGYSEVVELLLKSGVDPNSRASNWTVHSAAGAPTNTDAKLWQRYGMTAVWAAARSGQSTIVSILVDAGADFELLTECRSDSEDAYYESPLNCAIHRSHCDTAEILIQRGASGCATCRDSFAAVTIAARVQCLRCLNTCIKAGFSVNQVDSRYQTAIGYSAWRGSIGCLGALLRAGAEVDLLDSRGRTALQIAARCGHLECVRLLLEHDAAVNKPDGEGRTPLLRAAENGHDSCVSELLSRGAEPTTADKDGWTPLMAAASCNNTDCLKAIIKHDSTIDGPKNEMGLNALQIAVAKDSVECMTILLDHGARVTVRASNGDSLLHLAARHGSERCLRPLLNLGLDIDARDTHQRTPILHAIVEDQLACVETLLAHGANQHLRDLENRTVLHIASHKDRREIAALLIDNGADIQPTNRWGGTALHRAAGSGSIDCLQLFADRGAQLDREDFAGHPAICWARKNSHNDCVELLLRLGARDAQCEMK